MLNESESFFLSSQKWRTLCPRCWAMNCLGGQTPINSVRVTIKPLQLLFIRTCALLIVAPVTAIIFSAGLGLKLPMLEIEPSCVLTKNSGRSVIWLPGSYIHISTIITIDSVFTTIHILVLHYHQNIIITIHNIQCPWCVLSSECHHFRTCSPLALQLAPNYGLIAVLIIQAIDMSDPKGIDQLPEIV